MRYFTFFPTVPYNFVVGNTTITSVLTNVTARVKIMERLQQHITALYTYDIADGERPDHVSTRLYGTPDYTWVLLLVNNIFSLYDWPLNTEEFADFIRDKYGSPEAAQTTWLYSTSTGHRVDAITYASLTGAEQGSVVSAYDDEVTQNEAKRRIRVVPVEFVEALATELKTVMGT